jgi:hypothetical protein
MKMAALAEAYAHITKRHGGLPAMMPGLLRVQPPQNLAPVSAWDALAASGPVEGWLQFQSRVVCFDQGQMPRPEPDWGLLLAAEAVDGRDRSYLLRQDGSGALLLVVAVPGAEEGAEELLTDEVYQLATAKAPGKAPCRLHYRRYWRCDSEMGLVPVFAAFLGFACTEDR